MMVPFSLLLQLCIAHLAQSSLPIIRQLGQFENDPFEADPTPKLVAQFPDALGILGIAEIKHDVFAITKGNFTPAGTVQGSWSVWKADLSDRCRDMAGVSKIVDIPEALSLNGATTVGRSRQFLLLADSLLGVVWRVNLETAVYDIVLKHTAVQPTLSAAEGGFGVNGVHTRDGFLYFTNTNRGFYRVAVHDDGTRAGPFELLANFTFGDDFAFDRDGNAYVARGEFDIIDKITSTGKVTSLDFENANASVLIEGNTAVRFGRKQCDRATMYVTTNGGRTGLVKGTAEKGARVLAIDLEEQ